MTYKRMEFLRRLLDFIGLGERLCLEWISSAEARKFALLATSFTEKIRTLGPSPLAAFNASFPPRPAREIEEKRPELCMTERAETGQERILQ